jgi:hypothetical protein
MPQEAPSFFSGRLIGQTLREVAVDLIETETENIISRWYRASDVADLFMWTDARGNVIKQQLSFYGQVVEWNCVDGLRTGVIIEEDLGVHADGIEAVTTSSPKATSEEDFTSGISKNISESIRFDKLLSGRAVNLAMEIMEHLTGFEATAQTQMLRNFRDPKTITAMGAEEFAERFGLLLKNGDRGIWTRLKEGLNSLLKKSS